MTDSILNTTKKVLGIDSTYTAFDVDIIMHINTVFSVLNQLGVGPASPYRITTASNNWVEFTGTNQAIESVKSYVWAKVRLAFDPPTTSFAIESLEKLCTELEWRLNVQSEGIVP
jgi:hypothetical protein